MLLFKITAILWLLSLFLCWLPKVNVGRFLLLTGCLSGVIGAICALPVGTGSVLLPMKLASEPIHFQLNGAALWLCGFGLVPAFFAILTKTVSRVWLAGVGIALLAALGVFGLQDAVSFLISWELMSFGVAIMLLAEHKGQEAASSILFMMALLEVGAIALFVAFLLLSGDSIQFSSFGAHSLQCSAAKQWLIGVLLLIGFGAKLGLLPFYEWLPKAYSAGSGATGAICSGIILNAAFFGLMRSLFAWLPNPAWGLSLGVITVLVGVLTALLTILYAFQQSDWRRLLSYSSAENSAISVLTLGMALLFRYEQQYNLAAFAGVVALIHLAGHSLAKGALFIAADGVFCSNQSYDIKQNGLVKQLGWLFGVGALFAVMSLSAMPPQAGFVSEWYVFQTIFHGFHLNNLIGRYTLLVAGIGMALTAAISLATFIKVYGIGLLGAKSKTSGHVPFAIKLSVFILGLCILLLATGMVLWVNALHSVALDWFHFDSPHLMHTGWLLVPLSDGFAFISPTLLIIVCPLLALLPIGLVLKNRHYPIKRAPIWYGGLMHERKTSATSALTFANAMHYFYHFIYLPKDKVTCTYRSTPYFVKKISFSHQAKALFDDYLFKPIACFMATISDQVRLFQSGNLNFYNAIIGALLIIILCVVFF